jgi:hypothetical protein
MLAVPYLEKALYELPEEQLSVEALLALADRVEAEVQGGLSPRPLLSVPHILADEASCYCEWGRAAACAATAATATATATATAMRCPAPFTGP